MRQSMRQSGPCKLHIGTILPPPWAAGSDGVDPPPRLISPKLAPSAHV
eukprot:COSAG02_NODE_60277_length_271_cov_2.104651_1_plen_47_part_01